MTARIAYPLYRSVTGGRYFSPREARRALISALEQFAKKETPCREPVDLEINCLLKDGHLTWAVSDVYWHLLRKESKVPSGLIFTPPDLADSVVNELEPGIPVVDLGAGTGMLSITAARRGYQVNAVERDPELAHLLSCLATIEGVEDRINVTLGDALAFAGLPTSQIMSNPPYSRHQSLSRQEKTDLSQLSVNLGLPLPSTAGHYAYFMIYAWKASWSKKEVLLVPTNWTETKYGEPLRKYLTDERSVSVSITSQGNSKPIFKNALTTACILTTDHSHRVSTKSSKNTAFLSAIGVQEPRKNGTSPLAREVRTFSFRDYRMKSQLLRLGDILHISRGIATGANSLFVLSAGSGTSEVFPKDELVPIIRKLSRNDDTNIPSFLWVPRSNPSEASVQRIRFGEEHLLHLRTLCRTRSPWWRIPIPKSPAYLLSYMGRRQPVIVKNTKSLLNLNNIHGMDPVEGVSKESVERVVKWLRTSDGQNAMLTHARHYQGGLWKLEPGEMNFVDIPPFLVEDIVSPSHRTVSDHNSSKHKNAEYPRQVWHPEPVVSLH